MIVAFSALESSSEELWALFPFLIFLSNLVGDIVFKRLIIEFFRAAGPLVESIIITELDRALVIAGEATSSMGLTSAT